MENEFDEVMRKHTDLELCHIVNGPPDDYQPLAFEAAKREYDSRHLSQAQIKNINAEIDRQNQAEVELVQANRELPLETYRKVLAFLFPRIGSLITGGFYKSAGYDTQARELRKWTLFGMGFYTLIILISILTHKS